MYTFPSTEILSKHLADMLGNGHDVTIISRANFIESSTFPVEIVLCQTYEGKKYNLFCKYLAGMGPNNFGHRGGVEYEAKIYENILDKTDISKINYYGQCRLSDTGDLLLVIEYLGENLRMLYSGDPDAIIKAAIWIGKFHSIYENKTPEFITVYDKEYYFVWSERFRKLTVEKNKDFPWLNLLISFYEDNIDSLLNCKQSIIHGEFYPKNILLKKGIIYVIDWESAACSAGEIDLASLIEGWDLEMVEKIKEAYKKARWPMGENDLEEFNTRLLLAQIYFHFWWWEEKTEVSAEKEKESFDKLYHLALAAGL